MNRSVMQRQMFAGGGAAGLKPIPAGNMGLPNLPEDVRNNMGYMAEGGDPMMMSEGIMSTAPAMGSPSPEMMAQQGAEMMDPNTVASMVEGASAAGYSDPEQAGSFEEMMNSVSGENKSAEERRTDLASIVGPEDASQTPESVLALVTPVVELALVDQGIGPMAQEQMNTPVEGDMGGGIMTMAANGNMGVGNEPPVNFNLGGEVRRRGDEDPVPVFMKGGPVQYMEEGGVDFESLQKFMGPRRNITPEASQFLADRINQELAGGTPPFAKGQSPTDQKVNRLKELFGDKKEVYSSILGDPEEQKKMTQAQMLFDIANTALTFAAPMPGEKSGLSPAQRLAMAATTTKLPQTISARAAEARSQQQKLDLAALQAAETALTAETKAASDKEIALAKDSTKSGSFVIAVDNTGKVVGRYDQNNATDKVLIKNLPENVTLKKIGEEKNKTSKLINVFKDGKYEMNLDLSNDEDKKEYDNFKKDKKYTFFTVGNQPTPSKATKPKFMKIIPIKDGVPNVAAAETINVNSDNGLSKIAEINSKNKKSDAGPLFQIVDVSTEKQSMTPQAYILDGQIVYSFDGVNVRVKEDDKIVLKDITKSGAIIVTDETAFSVLKTVKSSEKAKKELIDLDTIELDGAFTNTEDFKAVTGAMNHARNGTGPWSTFQAFINNTLGGLTGTSPFKDNAESRNFLKAIELLSRTALVSNSRYALGEMAAISELYPNPDNVFRSPASEAAKFIQLKRFALQFKRDNLDSLAAGASGTARDSLLKHNRSLDRLLTLLSDVPVTVQGTGGGISMEQLNKAKEILKKKN
jgi:hypothetical protein